jgi:hypothetical protein
MAQQNKPRRSAGFGLVVGVGLGLLLGLVFKKLALGVLLGLAVAWMLYRSDNSQ